VKTKEKVRARREKQTDDISGQSPAKTALAASEIRYRRLFESAKDGILILDAETGIVVDVNPFLLDLLDYSFEKFIGKAIWELGFFKDIVANQNSFAELQYNKYIRYENKPLEDSSGRRHEVEFISNVYLVNGSKVIQCNIRDNTEHKQAKDKIQRLARFPSENPNPVLRVSAQGILEYANTAAELLLPTLGAKMGGAVSAEWQAHIGEAISKAHPIDIGFRAADRIFDATLAPVIDHGYVNLYVRDITEQTQAEKARDAARTFLQSVVDGLPEQLLVINRDYTIALTNRPFHKNVKMTSPDGLGLKCYEVSHNSSSPCDSDEHPCPMELILKTRRVVTVEHIHRNADGDEIAVEVLAAPIFDENGEVVQIIETVRDITERKQAEAEQENLQAQLTQAQKMEAVGRLAGGVAHDFNNMLQIILGHTEIVISQTAPDSSNAESLQETQKAALRSAALTRQLLAFARKQDIVPEILNLNDAVAGMFKMIQRLIGEDIKLVWRPGAALRPIKLDPSQIDQILANLCLNARDAIPDVGTITLETGNVTIDAKHCATHAEAVPGEYVFLAVSDSGCGMDRETLAKIFEPFFTTKEKTKGTGLGLATVYGIVKQNNGFIYAYSEPGLGTTFKIYLPQVEAEARKSTDESPAAVPTGRGETILLVEDEASLRTIYNLFLNKLGYTVLMAETPQDALRLFAQQPDNIQLLLTDVVMPGMNGKQVADEIHAVNPAVKVLFMSGYTTDIIADRGVLDQDIAFIAKPFSCSELAHKVQTTLRYHEK
jgi:two-component system cell cycle sensor histidine kinase/response regulator CckA